MPKKILTLDSVKESVDELVGSVISMRVCRGRKQVKNYTGVLEIALPRVFVVKLDKEVGGVKSLSYSYSDILCGEVRVEKI